MSWLLAWLTLNVTFMVWRLWLAVSMMNAECQRKRSPSVASDSELPLNG